MEDYLEHIGTETSGRYPKGSGKNPFQRGYKPIKQREKELLMKGFTRVEAANALGMNTNELRKRKSYENEVIRAANISKAQQLRDEGMSYTAIGNAMGGINESTVRSWLKPSTEKREAATHATVDLLKSEVEDKKYLDVGKGANFWANTTPVRLDSAVQKLVDTGEYTVHKVHVKQITQSDNWTPMKVLTKASVTTKEVLHHISEIGIIGRRFVDKFATGLLGLKPVQSIASRRVDIAYSSSKDGLIELRPGVKDLSLGDSKYAQVRIGVDGTHFMKGMAIYNDNLPQGKDIRYHTNKKEGTPAKAPKGETAVFKPMQRNADGQIDVDNPFKTSIKNGYLGQKGYLNLVNEEGDWNTWSKSISSQILSKQPVSLAKKQLELSAKVRENDFDVINNLTNPVLKEHFLNEFADKCDTAASHLKAAALPRQENKVILPMPELKENQVYAPTFNHGERVVLIRHPHAGTFEIPELIVNNNNRNAKKLLKNSRDAIAINPKVAEQLSGADFDGDSVIVIPNNDRAIKTSPRLEGLKNFDPHTAYPAVPGMKKLEGTALQNEMGVVSNLITDMTIRKASPDEIAQAARYSMVVIDAEKHNLNYLQAKKDNQINRLQKRYQPKNNGRYGGSSTLISRANANTKVEQKTRYFKIDPVTGEKIQGTTGATYTDKDGVVKKRLTKTTQMKEVSDARQLSSGTEMEEVYATYANKMKALGNKARKETLSIITPKASTTARKVYDTEWKSLRDKINIAERNTPLERKAQALAGQIYWSKYQDNPELGQDKDRQKKVKQQAIVEARNRVGTSSRKERYVDITPREWEAIQAGACSKTMQQDIFKNADPDKLKELAMPKASKIMTQAKINQAKAYIDRGYTTAEVAKFMGVSVGTLTNSIYPSTK